MQLIAESSTQVEFDIGPTECARTSSVRWAESDTFNQEVAWRSHLSLISDHRLEDTSS